MEVSGQVHDPASLPRGKESMVPIGWRLGGPQSRSGRGGEEIHFHPQSGLEPPILQPVAQRYTTELSRLLYRNQWVKQVSLSYVLHFATQCVNVTGREVRFSFEPTMLIIHFIFLLTSAHIYSSQRIGAV
jgi:hypothetical protein